jgi:hypothetical protein
MSLGAQISETDDSATRILPQMDGFDLILPFSTFEVECPDSRPSDSLTLERRYPDTNSLGLSLLLFLHEGLNLMHLLTDPMVVGYSE